MRRRRPLGKKIYTIDYLLEKQPKAIQKSPFYPQMIRSLMEGNNLSGVRFNKRCYSLLHNGVIKPEHLDNFYRTYRLPKHPFFPLFFLIKGNYLRERENKKTEKEVYITRKMESLPLSTKGSLEFLAHLERQYNSLGNSPLFKQKISPKTKKQAATLEKSTHKELVMIYENYLLSLIEKYSVPSHKTDQFLACLILHCIPPSLSQGPEKSQIKKSYRSLSKSHHPDAGGEHDFFIKLKWARDTLLG